MKFAKLGFETKEGLSLAHYQDGWSMEYGEGGSYNVDLLYKGKKIANVTEEGNGGPLMIDFAAKTHKEEDKAVLAYLARADKGYQPGSEYKFCLEALENGEAGECEYATAIEHMLARYSRNKQAGKYFKKGYKVMLTLDYGWKEEYVAAMTKERLERYIKEKNYDKADVTITYMMAEDLRASI